MSNKYGLGRGLDALIPRSKKPTAPIIANDDVLDDAVTSVITESTRDIPEESAPLKRETFEEDINGEDRILRVSPHSIIANDYQPRLDFDEEELEQLAQSVKEYGIMQPLVVEKDGDGYRLIAGERRLRASKKAGLETVPIIVRNVDDKERFALAIIENIQRVNLNPIETAIAYQRLADEFGLTQEEIATKMGMSRPKVANVLRLLKLHPEVQQAMREGKISEGHGKVLLSLPGHDEQLRTLANLLNDSMSVQSLTQQVRKSFVRPFVRATMRDPLLDAKETSLRQVLGTKVRIEKKGDSGKIVIEFYSPEELASIVDTIAGETL